MKLFQTVNSIILGPTGREETAWARTIGLNRGFAPGTQAPQCTTQWAIQQCKSHPSKTTLSCQHISTSLYLPCMQLHSLRLLARQ